MLIEQAFHHLPEILVGAGYARQGYKQAFEASIVAAFSLAILQELNGRNAPNPISFLLAEKRYLEKNERLRADLHVDLQGLFVGTKDYSDFGFRFSNWIEAKFFRVGKGTPPSTQNLSSFVADLFRLIALVPNEPAKSGGTLTGRYFLHVYKGNPLLHVNPKRKDGTKRQWVDKFLAPGPHKVDDLELAAEEKEGTFFQHLGRGFQTATCKMDVTNYKLVPSHKPESDSYTIILTRIDSASLSFNGKSLNLTTDRNLNFAGEGSFEQFREEIAHTLKPPQNRKARVKTDSGSESKADN